MPLCGVKCNFVKFNICVKFEDLHFTYDVKALSRFYKGVISTFFVYAGVNVLTVHCDWGVCCKCGAREGVCSKCSKCKHNRGQWTLCIRRSIQY